MPLPSFRRAPARLALSLLVVAALALVACASRSPLTANHRAAPVPSAAPATTAVAAAPTTAAPTTAAPTTAPPTTAAPVAAPVPPAPVWAGKGMWIWQPEYADGGDGSAFIA